MKQTLKMTHHLAVNLRYCYLSRRAIQSIFFCQETQYRAAQIIHHRDSN